MARFAIDDGVIASAQWLASMARAGKQPMPTVLLAALYTARAIGDEYTTAQLMLSFPSIQNALDDNPLPNRVIEKMEQLNADTHTQRTDDDNTDCGGEAAATGGGGRA